MDSSPASKKDLNIFAEQEESKVMQDVIEEKSFTGKPAITDFFYEDKSLGFKPEIAKDPQKEVHR